MPEKPKLSNFTLYFRSNCPRMSTPKFGLILNSNWSNVKLKSQTLVKINESDISSWLSNESNETKFNQIGLKIREKSLFGN